MWRIIRHVIVGADLAITEPTVKLVRIGLYEMYRTKPTITRFTLKDDSNLYCNGADYGQRISMAYESLLKYNQTWYQQKFGAVLPGFVSMELQQDTTAITITINHTPTTFYVKPDSLMFYFLQSLSNMDLPSTPYPSMIHTVPGIKKIQTEYESAQTPREFMRNVRAVFTSSNGKFDKEGYCYAVAPWFSFYMNTLRIPLYYDAWYIPVTTVKQPDGFKEDTMEHANALRILTGGRRKTRTKRTQWGIIPYYPTGRRFGGADELSPV